MPPLHRLIAAFALLAALSARAAESDESPQREDPLRRYRERIWHFGERTPEQGLRLLEIAHAEASRYGGTALSPQIDSALAPGGATTTLSRAPGGTWINLGPASAAYEKNGITYTKVDAGRVRRVLPHPTDPNILYVAFSGGGVWKTFNATKAIDSTSGPTWHPITESIGSLSIGSMAMDPNNPDSLLLGLGDPFDNQMPGLLNTTDGGVSWSKPYSLSGAYPGSAKTYTAMSVRDLAFDQAGTGVVLAATDVGLFRSASAGMSGTWSLVDLAADHSFQSCWSAAWIGPQTWLVACDGDLFRSVDGGASWVSVLGGLPAFAQPRVRRMTAAASAVDSANPAAARVYVLAAASDIVDPDPSVGTRWGTLDVFRSSDGGRTFSPLGVCGEARPDPTLPQCGTPTNWTNDQPDLDVLHDQAWYNQMIAVDPKNHDNVVIGGNLSMLRTRNGGGAWDVMSDWLPFSPLIHNQYPSMPYVHADWHAGTFSYAGDKLTFYGGTDGGIFRSEDLLSAAAGLATFEDGLNRGIASHLIYSIATDETDSSNALVLGGFQDNGTRYRAQPANPLDPKSPPTTFDQIWGGDGIGVGVGKFTTNPMGSLLVVTNPDSIQRSQDGGKSFAKMMGGLPVDSSGEVPGNFYMKIATDFGDANGKTFLTLVNAGDGGHVYKWVDNGSVQNQWSEITGSITLRAGGTASAFPNGLNQIGCDPKHPGQYGAVGYSRAYAKAAGSSTWAQSAATPLGALSSIAFDPANTQRFWVSSASGSSGGHVFLTADGGATWSVKAGTGATALPDVPANVVKVDPNDANTIYAGTEIGLYRSTDGGASWVRYGAGLPLVAVTDLSIALDSSAVRLATFGRGFWELYPSAAALAGMYGDGDLDGNQQVDGFDLVSFGRVLGLTAVDAAYAPAANLTGATNAIDDADLAALIAKLGGRP